MAFVRALVYEPKLMPAGLEHFQRTAAHGNRLYRGK
jgi:hypothetical protein